VTGSSFCSFFIDSFQHLDYQFPCHHLFGSLGGRQGEALMPQKPTRVIILPKNAPAPTDADKTVLVNDQSPGAAAPGAGEAQD
jgi:hypothetical protein